MASKAVELSEKLSLRIQSREWKAGEQFPSRQEVAAEYNVSPATVSNALKVLARKRLVRTIPGKGVFVVDPKQPDATPHITNRQHVIALAGCYLPQTNRVESNGMQAVAREPIIDGIWAAAAEMGCHLVLLTESRQAIDLDQLSDLNVDGLIMLGGYPTDELLKIRTAAIPAILATASHGPCPLNYVDYDNAQLMQDAVTEFAARGHRRIAFISTETSVAGYLDWLQFHFVRALLDHNLVYKYNDYWRSMSLGILDGLPSEKAFRQAGQYLIDELMNLPEPPTAVFCYQQRMLSGVEEALAARDLRVGKDVSLIADYDRDEDARFSGFTNPHVDKGRQLLENLLSTIHNRQHYCQRFIKRPFVDRDSIAQV